MFSFPGILWRHVLKFSWVVVLLSSLVFLICCHPSYLSMAMMIVVLMTWTVHTDLYSLMCRALDVAIFLQWAMSHDVSDFRFYSCRGGPEDISDWSTDVLRYRRKEQDPWGICWWATSTGPSLESWSFRSLTTQYYQKGGAERKWKSHAEAKLLRWCAWAQGQETWQEWTLSLALICACLKESWGLQWGWLTGASRNCAEYKEVDLRHSHLISERFKVRFGSGLQATVQKLSLRGLEGQGNSPEQSLKARRPSDT